ncbi:MAG: hypothetical protein ABSG84_10255 [Acidobacteriaceae bacterium]|jgi:hypothetical protein
MSDEQIKNAILTLISNVDTLSTELAACMQRDNDTVYEPGLESRINVIKGISVDMKTLLRELK